jgi:hypothetical protein
MKREVGAASWGSPRWLPYPRLGYSFQMTKMDFKNTNLGWSGTGKSGLIGAANRNSFVSEIEQKGKSFNPLFDS